MPQFNAADVQPPQLPNQPVYVNLVPLTTWQKIGKVLLSIVCFWKWFTPAKPLSDRQIQVIKDFKTESEQAKTIATSERFKTLLVKKVEILVGCVSEKFVKSSVDTLQKATIDLPDVIEPLLQFMQTASNACQVTSPLKAKLDERIISMRRANFEDVNPLTKVFSQLIKILPKLTKDIDEKVVLLSITNRLSRRDVNPQHLTIVMKWLYNPEIHKAQSLLDYVQTQNPLFINHELTYFIAQHVIKCLFELKQNNLPQQLRTSEANAVQVAVSVPREISSNPLTSLLPYLIKEVNKTELTRLMKERTVDPENKIPLTTFEYIADWILDSENHSQESLEEFVIRRDPSIPADAPYQVLKHAVEILFHIQKQRYPEALRIAFQSAQGIIQETIHEQTKAITTVILERLDQTIQRTAYGFSTTFDEIVTTFNTHIQESLNAQNQTNNATHVVQDLEGYIALKEDEYFYELAKAILTAVAPELMDEKSELPHNYLALPEKLTSLFEEGRFLIKESVPYPLQNTALGYLEAPIQMAFQSERTHFQKLLVKGLATTCKTIKTMLTKTDQQQALIVDSILPSINDNLKLVIIRDFFHHHYEELAESFGEYLNGISPLKKLQDQLRELVMNRADQMDWSTPEAILHFDRLTTPLLLKITDLLRSTYEENENTPLSIPQVKAAIAEMYKKEDALAMENAALVNLNEGGSIYTELIKTLVFKVGQFGKWNSRLFNIGAVQNAVIRAVLASIKDYRSSPYGLIDSSLESIDKTLTLEKFNELLSPSLESLLKSQTRVQAEIDAIELRKAKISAKIKINDQKTQANKQSFDDETKKVNPDQEILRKHTRKIKEIEDKNKELIWTIEDNNRCLDRLHSQLEQISADIEKVNLKNLQEQTTIQARQALRPQLIHEMAQVVFDLFKIKAENSGKISAWIARKVTGDDASHLDTLITTLFNKAFEHLEHPLMRIFHIASQAIAPGQLLPDLAEIQRIKASIDITPAPEPLALPQPEGLSASQIARQQVELSQNNSSTFLPHKLDELLKDLFDHLIEFAQKKVVKPGITGLQASTEGLDSLLKGYSSTLVTITRGDVEIKLEALKQRVNDRLPLDDLESIIHLLVSQQNSTEAAKLLEDLQKDKTVCKALSVIPCPQGQTIYDYTVPLLEWLFNLKNKQNHYTTLAVPAHLNSEVFYQVFNIYVDQLAAKCVQAGIDRVIGQLNGSLTSKINEMIKQKGQRIREILGSRLGLLFSKMHKGSFAKKFDLMFNELNATFALINKVNKEFKTHPKEKQTVTLKHQLIENELKISESISHEVTSQLIRLGPGVDPIDILNMHYQNMATRILSILIPEGVEQFVTSLGLFIPIEETINEYHESVKLFLTSKREIQLADLKNSFLTEVKKAAITAISGALHGILTSGVEAGVKALKPQLMTGILANTVLPLLTQTLLKSQVHSVLQSNAEKVIDDFQKLLDATEQDQETLKDNLTLKLKSFFEKRSEGAVFGHYQNQFICDDTLFNSHMLPLINSVVSYLTTLQRPVTKIDIEKFFQKDILDKVATPIKQAAEHPIAQLVTNVLTTAGLGVVSKMTSQLPSYINSAILPLLEDLRKDPNAFLNLISDGLAQSIGQKEVLRTLLFSGAGDQLETLFKRKQKLQRKIQELQQKNDPVFLTKIQRLQLRLAQTEEAIIKSQLDQQANESQFTKDKANLQDKRKALAQVLYDFIIYKLPTAVRFTAEQYIGTSEALHNSLQALTEEALLGDEILTGNTALNVLEAIVELLEDPEGKKGNSVSEDKTASINPIKFSIASSSSSPSLAAVH